MTPQRRQPRGPSGKRDPHRDETRRRRAEVFGEVLPDQTRDDRDIDGDRDKGEADGSERDRWLRRQVPPHHGG